MNKQSEDEATITSAINPIEPVADELNEQDLEKVVGGLFVNGPLGSGSGLRKSSTPLRRIQISVEDDQEGQARTFRLSAP